MDYSSSIGHLFCRCWILQYRHRDSFKADTSRKFAEPEIRKRIMTSDCSRPWWRNTSGKNSPKEAGGVATTRNSRLPWEVASDGMTRTGGWSGVCTIGPRLFAGQAGSCSIRKTVGLNFRPGCNAESIVLATLLAVEAAAFSFGSRPTGNAVGPVLAILGSSSMVFNGEVRITLRSLDAIKSIYMYKHDKYTNFTELKRAEPASAYRIRRSLRPSKVLIIAPHGGRIEPGTSQIAVLIAGETYNLYRFEGLKPRGQNKTLHITSHRFDERKALRLAQKCSIVLGIHGCKGWRSIYVGGRNKQLRADLAATLASAGLRVKAYGHDYHATHPLRTHAKINSHFAKLFLSIR